MTRWILPLLALAAAAAQAPSYTGPVPPKTDVPYLKHAGNIVETEAVEFKEEKSKDDVLYTAPGEASPAKTPLALPMLLIKADKVNPQRLQMYRLEAKDGHREITASGKKKADVIHVLVTRLTSDGVFRMEVADGLESGQYVLSLEGTNQGFCFTIE
jgi:hypothetical protein